MGNLLGGAGFREPTTVDDCDSTWHSDSEPEPEPPAARHAEAPGQEPAPDPDAQAAGAEQGSDSTEATTKPKRSFYAARDLYKYRHQYPEFKKTKEAIRRFLLAYKMMLEFFGIKLIDKTGNVARAVNWQERFQHLNESQHNYLRITRILKSLGELGYESFKSPLVKFILHEALVENTIPNIKQSALEYFVYTIRDRRERRKLLRFAQKHYTPPENFIWGPPRKEQPEGSRAQKVPAASAHSTQTSMHKKPKDTKNPSPAHQTGSNTAEEKPVTAGEAGEEPEEPSEEPSSDVATPGDPEDTEKDGDAEGVDPSLEKTLNGPQEKQQNTSPQKDDQGEDGDRDCEKTAGVGAPDDVLVQ